MFLGKDFAEKRIILLNPHGGIGTFLLCFSYLNKNNLA